MSRKRRRSSSKLYIALILIAIVAYCSWLNKNNAKQQSETHASQTEGSSSQYSGLMKVSTESSLSEKLINYTGMDVSFNADKHVPNWVAWELTGEEANGTLPRENSFYSDDKIDGCAETYDYNYSGYDRGHMAPAGDMKWSSKAMHETFCLTNICPQAKQLNTGAWKRLEEKCRTWAKADSAIVIVCGPILNEKPIETIGDTRVVVPRRFFKVILSPYSNPPRGIGFIMPNDKVTGGLQAAAVTIDSVENLTGHDFFYTLPDDIETIVESQCDFHYWSTHK